jgi:hypothetical protein
MRKIDHRPHDAEKQTFHLPGFTGSCGSQQTGGTRAFFDRYREKMICLDEIQMLPEFFSVLRSEIDKDRRSGRFLILGSASRDLIRQSTETLAGRIAYLDLSPFLIHEVPIHSVV